MRQFCEETLSWKRRVLSDGEQVIGQLGEEFVGLCVDAQSAVT
jgi:hypothetical protein